MFSADLAWTDPRTETVAARKERKETQKRHSRSSSISSSATRDKILPSIRSGSIRSKLSAVKHESPFGFFAPKKQPKVDIEKPTLELPTHHLLDVPELQGDFHVRTEDEEKSLLEIKDYKLGLRAVTEESRQARRRPSKLDLSQSLHDPKIEDTPPPPPPKNEPRVGRDRLNAGLPSPALHSGALLDSVTGFLPDANNHNISYFPPASPSRPETPKNLASIMKREFQRLSPKSSIERITTMTVEVVGGIHTRPYDPLKSPAYSPGLQDYSIAKKYVYFSLATLST
jgi:hypothetical protein